VTLLDDRKTARVSFGTPFEYSQTYNLYIPAAVTNLAGISSDLPLIQRVFTTGADPDAPANDVVVVDSRYFSTGNYGYNYYVTIKNGFAGHKSGVIIIAQYFGGKLVDVKMLPFDNLTGKTESDELLVGNFNIKDKQPSTFTAYVWDGADNLSPYTTATALPTP
jgi:hypothetical protein